MGLIHVTTRILSMNTMDRFFEADFLVDTGATDSMVPASELDKIGLGAVGSTIYELASGEPVEYRFGLGRIEFMGEVTAGRVIFGPEESEPILGVTALESVGILVDPTNRTLKRLPAIPLKQVSAILRR